MDQPTAGDVLARLSDPATSQAEAEALMAGLDGREAESALPVFSLLHDARDEAELHAAVRLLARWADRPVAQALRPALAALVAEPGVGDLNRLAAADLLSAYGQPVDRVDLAARLNDPVALAQGAVKSALAAVGDPLALVNFLDALQREPQSLVLRLIDDLATLGDRRAVAVLVPLAQTPDADLAASAVVALDALGAAEAVDMLVTVASAHPDETVRRQADLVVRRLADHRPRRAGGPLAEAFLSPPDARGGQYVVLLRRDEGRTGMLTLYHTPDAGVVQYAAAGLVDVADQASLFDRLEAAGQPLSPASAAEAERVLEAAALRTLAAGGSEAIGYAAWPWVLGILATPAPVGG
jgi:hypothetical protein